MTQFTRSQLNLLRKQLQETIDNANLSDIKIEVGNCSYNGGEATFKVKCLLKGAKTREQEDLEYYAKLHQIDTTIIAKLQGEDMSLIGYKSRARKKPWILQRLRDGAEFVCADHTAKAFFKKREEIA
tara:strand:- start:324 stop:704 length:381 start_codon:yes stop_codon:yes gene_type:complete